MTSLNLLPPEEKFILNSYIRARIVAAAGVGIVSVALVGFALLLPTMFFIGFQKFEVVRAARIESESQQQLGIAEKIAGWKSVERLANAARAEEQNRYALAELMESIVRTIPPEVSLRSFHLSASTGKMTLDGFAPTRQVFLEFLKSLESHPRLSDVSSPAANLIRSKDIEFSVSASFK